MRKLVIALGLGFLLLMSYLASGNRENIHAFPEAMQASKAVEGIEGCTPPNQDTRRVDDVYFVGCGLKVYMVSKDKTGQFVVRSISK
jgi:hypothetical protein